MAGDQITAPLPAIETFLAEQENKELLRFITCGSVDDGKSTLIGRLLFDSKLIYEDQLAALERDSKTAGTTGDDIDLALLVDGLQAEREQGITIDVAYRFFSTDRRKFIVADTPGHEQYTRNMATGASTASLAVILIDARKGMLTQTRRHSFIVSLMGIRHLVLAVNKMDLVDNSQQVFDSIVHEYKTFAGELGLADVTCIPISALTGDNVLRAAATMPWYDGPTLMAHLETVDVGGDEIARPFRFPVQLVARPNLDFRGYGGTIASGRVRPGDKLAVLPSGRTSEVARIATFDGDLDEAVAGQAVTITLADEIDISRGDLLAAADSPGDVSDQFGVHLLWMSDDALYPGREYLMQIGAKAATATVSELKHKVNINTLAHQAAKDLHLNEIGWCNISLDQAVPFDSYQENRRTGAFILVDRLTNGTVGAGMIGFALRRGSNIAWQELDVDKAAHSRLKSQKPGILWFTGLSGSGKSTIANLVEKRLHAMGRHTYLLDGDNVRHGLNRDLGFTDADRVENIRRVSEVAKLFVDAGVIVLVSFISPFRGERRMARETVDDGEFLEVYVDTPLEICEARDPKGLYEKARAGKIANFTGIDSPYEPPENAELTLKTDDMSPEEAADQVIAELRERGMIA